MGRLPSVPVITLSSIVVMTVIGAEDAGVLVHPQSKVTVSHIKHPPRIMRPGSQRSRYLETDHGNHKLQRRDYQAHHRKLPRGEIRASFAGDAAADESRK